MAKIYAMIILLLGFSISDASFAACKGVNLIIMRHGHGEHTLYNIRNSRINSKAMHLTQRGIAEVESTARELLHQGVSRDDISEVISSPLARTRETAAVLLGALSAKKTGDVPSEEVLKALEKPLESQEKQRIIKVTRNLVNKTRTIQINPKLIERDFAECENQRFDIPCKKGEIWLGESYASVAQRAKSVLEDLKDRYCSLNDSDDPPKQKNILITTHDIVAKQMIKLLTNQGEDLKTGKFRILPLSLIDAPPSSNPCLDQHTSSLQSIEATADVVKKTCEKASQ